jgi:hypothetical protein
MSVEKTGALVSRGVGVALIIMGVSSMLYWPSSYFLPSGLVTSGWTSYSPLATTTTVDPAVGIRDSFESFAIMAKLYLPNVAQLLGGVCMLVWSKPVGRWLARGLSDEEDQKSGKISDR